MEQMKKIFFFWLVISMSTSCDIGTEICEKGKAAKLYYTPDCATINGHIILEGGNKTYVFQHEIDEQFQGTGIDVCVQYEIEPEPIPLTAECTQADVITIIHLKER
ncbi:hypothetical protein APR41_04000 [Salegentibacter salinarum]|uniref:Uncharacterized protein n=1 Tax=Salegentibacter salinarum TaxID=447422 RepID=A0A2N0TUA2_9FLAO|nr:hypothetical protein [Salegentibacter salinarum]PKD18323.1 hypothetical protein APR41_04000 [Salegentibacter salinarum]